MLLQKLALVNFLLIVNMFAATNEITLGDVAVTMEDFMLRTETAEKKIITLEANNEAYSAENKKLSQEVESMSNKIKAIEHDLDMNLQSHAVASVGVVSVADKNDIQHYFIAKSNVDIRRHHSMKSRVIGTIYAGWRVEVSGEKGVFYKLSCHHGYVLKELMAPEEKK